GLRKPIILTGSRKPEAGALFELPASSFQLHWRGAMPESSAAEYKVDLDNYYGPLDLLLHLVKETEVDITAIALARACEQYISFLTTMEKLDLSLSGNFLALASQLLLIKSRTIAPPEIAPEGESEGEEEE